MPISVFKVRHYVIRELILGMNLSFYTMGNSVLTLVSLGFRRGPKCVVSWLFLQPIYPKIAIFGDLNMIWSC